MRFVIYHKKHGIYLGSHYWSITNPGKSASAPTFDKNNEILRMAEAAPQDIGLEVHQVHPDLPGFRCSPEAIANVGLPRWGKEAIPGVTGQPIENAGGTKQRVMQNLPAKLDDEDEEDEPKAKKKEHS